ncbi:MAG: hypothetical protein K8T10_02520 [Candidatus Eremiobacteraeota bacterium]|nr:hypothetical protein [Candidatus Eremiobacteraeota bacterium]
MISKKIKKLNLVRLALLLVLLSLSFMFNEKNTWIEGKRKELNNLENVLLHRMKILKRHSDEVRKTARGPQYHRKLMEEKNRIIPPNTRQLMGRVPTIKKAEIIVRNFEEIMAEARRDFSDPNLNLQFLELQENTRVFSPCGNIEYIKRTKVKYDISAKKARIIQDKRHRVRRGLKIHSLPGSLWIRISCKFSSILYLLEQLKKIRLGTIVTIDKMFLTCIDREPEIYDSTYLVFIKFTTFYFRDRKKSSNSTQNSGIYSDPSL